MRAAWAPKSCRNAHGDATSEHQQSSRGDNARLSGRSGRAIALLLVAVVAALVVALLTPTAGGASAPRARTTVDKTINVAASVSATTYANDAPVGARPRLQRANETNEVKGYTFAYKGFADDNNDPATALSRGASPGVPGGCRRDRARRVDPRRRPTISRSRRSRRSVRGTPWRTAQRGRLGRLHLRVHHPREPEGRRQQQWVQLKKALADKGIKNPTAALIGTDQASGKVSVAASASGAQDAGFKVVYAKGAYPAPPTVVGDYSPYAAGDDDLEQRQPARRASTRRSRPRRRSRSST